MSLNVEDRKPRDCEARIEFEPCAGLFARFLETAEARERGREPKMGRRPIRTELNRPVQPCDRLLVATSCQFGELRRFASRLDARVSRGLMRSASRTCLSVSSLRPANTFAMPIHPWAAARFRLIASARSHSAMPWAARLLYMRKTPNAQCAFALSGLNLSALPKSDSAARCGSARSLDK